MKILPVHALTQSHTYSPTVVYTPTQSHTNLHKRVVARQQPGLGKVVVLGL